VKNRSKQIENRRGSVPIEVLIFLTCYATLIVLILAVGVTGPTIIAAISAANREAWSRHLSATSSTCLTNVRMGSMGRLLGPNAVLRSDSGIVIGQATREPARGVVPFIDDLPAARRERTLLLGTWDFREIQFEEASFHPRLKLTEKARCFLPHSFDLNFMQRLVP
jgi:hypothetical protein